MSLLAGSALLLALLGLLTAGSGARQLRRRRIVSAGSRGIGGCCLLALGGLIGALALNLQTYARLSHEGPVARVSVEAAAADGYRVLLERADAARTEVFELRGDAWQIDARVLRWRGPAALLGLDTRYRLERIGGRYDAIAKARRERPSVHALTGTGGLDLWRIARRYGNWLPLVDAVYGSAAYVPLADGSRWRVSIGRDGLIVRPDNTAAEQAIAQW